MDNTAANKGVRAEVNTKALQMSCRTSSNPIENEYFSEILDHTKGSLL